MSRRRASAMPAPSPCARLQPVRRVAESSIRPRRRRTRRPRSRHRGEHGARSCRRVATDATAVPVAAGRCVSSPSVGERRRTSNSSASASAPITGRAGTGVRSATIEDLLSLAPSWTRHPPGRSTARFGRRQGLPLQTRRPRDCPRGVRPRRWRWRLSCSNGLADRGAGVLRAASRPASRLVHRPEPTDPTSPMRSLAVALRSNGWSPGSAPGVAGPRRHERPQAPRAGEQDGACAVAVLGLLVHLAPADGDGACRRRRPTGVDLSARNGGRSPCSAASRP